MTLVLKAATCHVHRHWRVLQVESAEELDFLDFARSNLRSWQRVWGLGWIITIGLFVVEIWHGFDSSLFLVEMVLDIADLALLSLIWRRKGEWKEIVERLDMGEEVLIVQDD